MTENDIQQQLVMLLRAYCRRDVCWFAVPNGEWRYPKTAARLQAQGVRAGAPDMVFIVRGEFHGLEIKRERGRVSETQDTFAGEILQAGGHYGLCRGLEQTLQYLSGLGVFRAGVKFTFRDKEVVAVAKAARLAD